jgi:hypothetical protein
MEINLGDEQIIELQATFAPEQILEKAMAKRVDAFGQVAKLIQRPKPEDIEITATQKRLEPFWIAAAKARYVYDRRQSYRIPVTPEVQSVKVYGNEHPVTADKNRVFVLESVDRCVEEIERQIVIDAKTGNEVDLGKYLNFPKQPAQDLASLENDGTVVVPPEVRGSFVVRKLVALLMKTFQADKIHEERIDVNDLSLCYRPVYAIEFLWKTKQKRQVVEFDALTGDMRAEGGEIKKRVVRVLENDALFDIGADAVGTVLPGANIAVKLGRLAARKVVR